MYSVQSLNVLVYLSIYIYIYLHRSIFVENLTLTIKASSENQKVFNQRNYMVVFTRIYMYIYLPYHILFNIYIYYMVLYSVLTQLLYSYNVCCRVSEFTILQALIFFILNWLLLTFPAVCLPAHKAWIIYLL